MLDSKSPDPLQKFLLSIVLAASLVIVITYLFSMGLGILVVFSTIEGLAFSRNLVYPSPLLFIDIGVPVNAGLYFLFLWWIFVLCFAAALKYRESLASRLRKAVSGTEGVSLFRNNLIAMPVIASMLLVAVMMLHLLQTSGGIPTGQPNQTEPFLDLLMFSQAPLAEELVFRIIPIGAFLVTYIPLAGRNVMLTFTSRQRLKMSILSIAFPDKAKELLGLKNINENGLRGGIVWGEWVMVGLTAFLFGVAHYLGGWEIGKISQATLTGAVFGVAYLYYGIQAPILLHWYFNYYFTVFDLSLDYLASMDFTSIVWLANLSFGIFLWLAVLTFGALALTKGSKGASQPAQPPPPPPPF